MSRRNLFMSFEDLYASVKADFANAPVVRPPRWQGVDVAGKPDMETFELLNHHSTLWLPDENLDGYREDIRPDLPWADDHFEERVCGYPMNPGTQWAKWRLGGAANDFRDADGRFNHNYMERFWPKYAGQVEPSAVPQPEQLRGLLPHFGIRYAYGDMLDVIELLLREPMTRQAFLPIFFPEDTGAVHRDRTPCTLGWQFILRAGSLHMVYFLRSCDAVNHWRNDIYMAVRLLLRILEVLRAEDPDVWEDVTPGTLTTHITSLHCFRGVYHKL